MRKNTFWIILVVFVYTNAIAQTKENTSLLSVNYEKLVSRADLIYDKPVSRSEEGMPIGNGVMGSLVWTTPSALHFQLNRVDVFGNNSASNNFYERHTDYCGGIGFADIEFVNGENNIFNEEFQQRLSCYDGVVTAKGKGITAKVLAWSEQDVMVVQIEDLRNIPVLVNLRPLRLPITRKGNHQAISSVKLIGNKIVLLQEIKEDSYYNGSVIVIEVVGREARAGIENPSLIRLSTAPGDKTLSVLMATAASFDPVEDLIASASNKLEAAKKKGFDGLLESNKQWWHDFWKKSFIHLHSKDGEADLAEKHYTYYLYVMASSSRGKYPTKFNGMLWSTGGDERKWGNLFWGANQSCLYNALLQTNHPELMAPMFNMYSSAYENFAIAARQQWNSKGIFIPETVSFDGVVPLPDNIATEMQELYLLKKKWEDRSDTFTEFASTKIPFHSRWNWKKDVGWENGKWISTDKGGGAFGHVTHIFSRGAKIAYLYWLQYELTQDVAWLRNDAYPMLKGVAEFYRNFPNVKKEQDGKYHIYHVNDNESVWGGHNTVEEISSMMGVFPAAIRASEILNVDADLRAQWKEFVGNLSPLAVNMGGKIDEHNNRPTRWIRSLPPMVQGQGDRSPDSNTMPVWFFDLCTLESDKKMRDIANTTYDSYFTSGINDSTKIYVLSRLAIAGSLLGRKESTRYLLPNQIRTAEVEVMPNRMDMREGPQTTSVQRLGRAAEALQLALCQSVPPAPGGDPVIRIFPAWPESWNAEFTLLCRGAFLVTASFGNGTIKFAEIISQGGAMCRIRNPWPQHHVDIYRNGKLWKHAGNGLITFDTKKNDRFIIVRKNDDPTKYKKVVSGEL
jgi:hypothetical protein